MSGPEWTNHLAGEMSPYLQRHVHNPVDWYPWGKEAFDLANRLDRPIFLSIGYATCHWCHVMERESFASKEVADVLNSVFVNILVDREELPEIDSLYMELSQALMSTAGGWPLNVILTPDLKPFFAVTYLPAKTQRELIGLIEFAKQMGEIWKSEERAEIIKQADQVLALFEDGNPTTGSLIPPKEGLTLCVEELFDVVDPVYGGIKGEPKFPMSYACDFMYGFAHLQGDTRSLFFANLTLDRMHRGGIYDHLGGGFSRYSIDSLWHVPHFEKTLVDNALIARSYLQGWRSQKNPLYMKVVRETLDYILCRLSNNEGGFWSAEDADLEGEEGRYYTWTLQEIFDELSPPEAELFCSYYSVTSVGNFEGRNVLHTNLSLSEFADALQRPEKEIEEELTGAVEKLRKKRGERPFPFIDEKVVSSSNGFAIVAFALAGRALGESRYTEAAVRGATFLQMNLVKEGRLFRRYCGGEAGIRAGLDDYAAVISAALTLFETGHGSDYLRWAMDMTETLSGHFKVPGGAFYQTDDEEMMILRKCDFYDGAEPSANAVHAENLVRLFQITQDQKYLVQAEDVFKAVGEFMMIFPPGACYHLKAFMRYLQKRAPVVIVALNREREYENELQHALFSHMDACGVILWKGSDDHLFERLIPQHAEKVAVEGKTTLYVCRAGVCSPPVTKLEEMLEKVKQL